jgi:hypothetical protein
VKAARDVAEEGALDAVRRLGVAEPAAPGHLTDDAKALRRRLRAHARTLGDLARDNSAHDVRHLIEATGYAQWHRRLFARFLAERGLLRHPEHGSVTLEDCEELAKLEGFADAWTAAETYGARMLPGVFNPDDPVLALEFAPEHAQALRGLVDGLDPAIFQADDSLGWTYQFWRAAEKDRVNRVGGKIGAAELPAVTQLFTEPYMVRFLLHNTLGAWRAGKILLARPDLATNAVDENALRAAAALPGYDFDLLRFVKEGEDSPRWRPAAGTFPGWPGEASRLTVLDPCCGSGHFLTETLTILAGIRAEEETLSTGEAVAAVLNDNLFGLEIDGRCVQIAAFAVVLTAWKVGGFHRLPSPHIAWVGSPPPLPRTEFVALADEDSILEDGLDKLWDLFEQAPLLGSLIQPTHGDLMSPQRLGRIEPLLDRLVDKMRKAAPMYAEGVIAARGMVDAAECLNREYTLVATNVPFLGRGKQSKELLAFADENYPESKGDLATMMIGRCVRFCSDGGTIGVISPNSWTFLSSYKSFRKYILRRSQINFLARLGSGAFETISGEVVNVTAVIFSVSSHINFRWSGMTVANEGGTSRKITQLGNSKIIQIAQERVNETVDYRFIVADNIEGVKLERYAESFIGQLTGDGVRYILEIWELPFIDRRWEFIGTTVDFTRPYGGCSQIILWEGGSGHLCRYQDEINRTLYSTGAWKRGWQAWGKLGIRVSQMGSLASTIHTGIHFDNNSAVIMPKEPFDIAAMWCYCSSEQYSNDVRELDQKLNVTNATLVKVNFDIAYWREIAAERYPNGLPEPSSDDPTQWLFHGHPLRTDTGTALHVALARMAGYRWPAESDPDMLLSADARIWIVEAAALSVADNGGLLSLEAVAGEQPLAGRLRAFLSAAFGGAWSDDLERKLVAEADLALDKKAAQDISLETWLRDRAFRQHCRLFHSRPFLWQVWDGTPDGFSAFVNYHRLDNATLSKLTYTLLGDWIGRMANTGDERRVEKAQILQQKLTAILEGEAPLDIFVRWKPLEAQPIGWNPDLDDGVRLNIRPFVEAGVLRETPKIKWGVDRGKDVASAPWFPLDKGVRNNDRHLTLAEKRAARRASEAGLEVKP